MGLFCGPPPFLRAACPNSLPVYFCEFLLLMLFFVFPSRSENFRLTGPNFRLTGPNFRLTGPNFRLTAPISA